MVRILLASALFWGAGSLHALTLEDVKAMAVGSSESRLQALANAATDPNEATLAFIQALADDEVKIAGGLVLVVKDDKAFDPVSGNAVALPDNAEDVINNNLMRGELDNALATLKLFSPKEAQRKEAIKTLRGDNDAARLPLIEKAYAAEKVPQLKEQLGTLRAAILLSSSDKTMRLQAAALLANSGDPSTKTVLLERLAQEPDADVKVALAASLRKVEATLAWGERLAAAFSGISLGSILLLVALGLAITYGLMGVINMAHGELMMIG
ncbi:MAG: urea ABC transporter permease subunit UrtB, partial [Polaromonas sp.]|nr:urea ABC transporter permease subunit UrtB [Polaromonas sp.]